jgi:hypothetical protein
MLRCPLSPPLPLLYSSLPCPSSGPISQGLILPHLQTHPSLMTFFLCTSPMLSNVHPSTSVRRHPASPLPDPRPPLACLRPSRKNSTRLLAPPTSLQFPIPTTYSFQQPLCPSYPTTRPAGRGSQSVPSSLKRFSISGSFNSKNGTLQVQIKGKVREFQVQLSGRWSTLSECHGKLGEHEVRKSVVSPWSWQWQGVSWLVHQTIESAILTLTHGQTGTGQTLTAQRYRGPGRTEPALPLLASPSAAGPLNLRKAN